MILIPTMDDWWELTQEFPSYQYVTDRILKEFGYMAILRHLKTAQPRRILEFGHGFNPTLFEPSATREDAEVWGIDDFQGLRYFPEKEEWYARHQAELVDPFPKVRFIRGLLGSEPPTGAALPENYFDFICSVSVLEEVSPRRVTDILSHCARLLRPGGVLMNSHDICLSHWERVGLFFESHRQAGLRLDATPEEEHRLANEDLVDAATLMLQNPAKIMINRKRNQGEHVRYPGHWTTLVVAATRA